MVVPIPDRTSRNSAIDFILREYRFGESLGDRFVDQLERIDHLTVGRGDVLLGFDDTVD